MNRFSCLFITFLFILLCLTASAHDFEDDGIYYNITSDSDLTVSVTFRGSSYSSYSNEYSGDMTIPEKVMCDSKEYSVTSIGDYAFWYCSGLTSVTIPNSVTNIEERAFQGCSGLTSVTIPNSVTSIDNRAFYNCSGLTSMIIPNSVTSIGNYAFYGCTGALTVNCNIPSASNGSSGVFYYSKFTSVTIGVNVTEIGNYAFYQCSGLTSVTIPNSVTSIGNYAFYNCSGLTNVTIPNSVTSIGSFAFYDCTSLSCVFNESDLSITKGSTSNGYVAYYAKCVVKGKGEIIDDYMFRTNETGEHYLCGYFGTEPVITLPAKYRGEDFCIDEYAFSGNADLVSVTIPSSVTSIGNYAFSGCSGLTNVTIPNSVTSIGNYAFSGCSGLTNVTIPNSVTSIDNHAFFQCSGLTSVTIPNSVTSIGSYAFYNCSGLTSMIIPNSVTSIGNSAFSGCSGLTSMIIPNSVTNIGSGAFYNCKSLYCVFNESDLSITKGSTSNGYVAYYAKCVIKGKGEIIDDYVFRTNETYEHYLCGYLGTETVITLPEKYRGENYGIDESAFSGNADLVSVTIPSSVTSIGSSAFYQCSGLTSVTIPSSVTSIGNYAFYYCSSLTSLTIPNSVTSIGECAFADCSGLTSLTIPNSVTSIGDATFRNCLGLTNVNIPNSVTSIGSEAFRGCSGLTNLTIPNSVTNIGSSAFYDCKSLHCVFNESDLSITKGSTSNGYVAYYAKCVVKGKGEIIDDYVFRTNETDEHYLCGYLGTETVITLPEKYRGEDYGIDESAFSGNADLVSVTIPSSVTSIGSSAFFNCTSLISVYSERENPLTVDYSVFACKNKSNSLEVYIPNEASLYVPYGCKAAYEGEAGWSTFKNIVEINPIICEIKDTAVIIEKELSLPISIRNDVGITGFQCDIYIPEGLTLKTNEKGEYDITLNEERCDDHSIYMRRMPDGAVRIIVMSMSSSDIIGTEGNMLTLNLIAGDSIGNHKVEVKNFNASDQKGKLYNANDTTGTVAVYYIPGDVNNDGMVAVNDIVYVVNYLLEDIAPDFHFSAADMDGDGNVFINDVVLIVNKILNAEPNTGQANN